MAGHVNDKLNLLLAELGDGWLAPSAWLTARGYSRSLLGYYVQRGWPKSPARGVFHCAGSKPSWQTVVFSMQRLAGLPLHVGGRHALSVQGLDHYVRIGPATVTFYGQTKLPPRRNAQPSCDCVRNAISQNKTPARESLAGAKDRGWS